MRLRQILAIVTTDLKRMLRRRDTIVWLLIMPLPYTYFFGAAFHSSPEQKIAVTVVAPQADAGSNRLIEALKKHDYEVQTLPAWTGKTSLPDHGYRVDLPPALGKTILDGATTEIGVWSKSGGMDATRLKVILQQAVLGLRAELFARLANGEIIAPATLATPLSIVPIAVEAADWGVKREVPSGFKQAIPGNMVMFVLMSVLVTGAIRLLMDRESGRLERMLATPTSSATVVLAQFLSLGLLGMVEALYFLLLGRIVFGQSLGPHPMAVVGVLLLMVAAACGIGVILGATLRTAKQAAAVGIFATLILAALGGCWWPVEILPAGMKALALALPTGQTMHALVRLMVWGDSPAALLGYAVYMTVLGVASAWIAARLLRSALV